jgi:hypothetical protein
VLGRFEGLASKLESQFISKDIFKLYSDGVARELEHLVTRMNSTDISQAKALDIAVAAEKERNEQLEKRISKLEANITWIVRIVVAAVIVAVLAAAGFKAKAGGGG